MSGIDELIEAAVERGIAKALEPYLPKLTHPDLLVYTYAQAGQALGCTDRHIANLVARGHLPIVENNGGKRVIPRSAVETFANNGRVTSASSAVGGVGADVTRIRSAAS